MRGRDHSKHGLGLVPLVGTDQGIGQHDLVFIRAFGVFGDLLPDQGGLGRLLRPDQGFGQTAHQVDTAGVFLQRAGEIGHRLIRVGDRKHHIIKIGFVDDVDVFEGPFNLRIRILFAGRQDHCARKAQHYKTRVAHLLRPFC